MGTRFELVLVGGPEHELRALGESAFEEIVDVHRRMNAFASDSVISLLNREAHRYPVTVDADTFALLETCRSAWAATDGAFDPTVGPLLSVWGLRGEGSTAALGAQGLDRTRECVGFHRVELDPTRHAVRFHGPSVSLDLGGIAKGWALDRAREVLLEQGIEAALLHGGTSSVIAVGHPPELSAWQVSLRDPRAPSESLATVHLRDTALGVSAPHGRQCEGRGHVIDPRTGHPTERTLLAALVHENATWADALSTALLIDGGRAQQRASVPGTIGALVLDPTCRSDPRVFGPTPSVFRAVPTPPSP